MAKKSEDDKDAELNKLAPEDGATPEGTAGKAPRAADADQDPRADAPQDESDVVLVSPDEITPPRDPMSDVSVSDVSETSASAGGADVDRAADLVAPVHDPRDEADGDAATLGAEIDDLSRLDGIAPEAATDTFANETPDTEKPATDATASETPDRAAVTPPPPPPAETVVKHRFFPAVLGGIVAAAIGFGAAVVLFPEGLPVQGNRSAVADEVAALKAEVAQLKTAEPDLSGVTGDIESVKTSVSGLESSFDGTSETLGALSDRIAELENRIGDAGGAPTEAVEALNGQVAALQQALTDQKTALEQQIQSSAARSRTGAAMTEIDTALDVGDGYQEAVNTLTELGVSVPEGLEKHADTGVPTLAVLQQNFADYARDALGATWDLGDTSSVLSFVKTQLGMRSLTPKEGDSPDAILSRAEAALRNGDLATTLQEVDTLPDAAKAEMQGWTEMATARAEAVEGRQALEPDTQTN